MFIITVAVTLTEMLKWAIITFVLFSKVIFSKYNGWANFLNNISLLGHMKIQSVIYLLYQGLQLLNLAEWWISLRCSHWLSHMTLWSCGQVMSRDKTKTLYLYFHRTYKSQTWYNSVLGWGAALTKSHVSLIIVSCNEKLWWLRVKGCDPQSDMTLDYVVI